MLLRTVKGISDGNWSGIQPANKVILMINFPAKKYDKSQGYQSLFKKASTVPASKQKDKKQTYSDGRLANKLKQKKKTPSCLDRNHRQPNVYWKRMKVARQLRAENLVAHYARLEETRMVANSQSPVI